MTWYAWSNISSSKDPAGRPIVTRCGEEVTPKSLGLNQKQFDELIQNRAVRAEPYPEIAQGSTIAPSELLRRRLAVEEGRLDEAELMAGTQVVRVADGLHVPGLIPSDEDLRHMQQIEEEKKLAPWARMGG